MTRKLAVYSPMHMTVAPAMPNSEPTRKPMLRPMRCISSAAGNTQIITPMMLHRDRQVGETRDDDRR